jgi:pyridoxal phosphate enzyme (YggS family)
VIQITDHLARVRQRVENAALVAGRCADDITIVAVSKKQSAAAIAAAHAAGQRDFGENFVQEAVSKITAIELPDIRWHFIGQIQSNKTKAIARYFDWVHTIDRLKTARKLDAQRPHFAAPLEVCIQVNLAGEPQKGGVAADEVLGLAAALQDLPHLRLRGLMTVPPLDADAAATGATFERLLELKSAIVASGYPLDTLSMGMSADLEPAIQCGSTMVRIGTAIFGPR